ncbi:MAG: FMN-binding protein [Firmicutes bacterium]|nr:FMN-binding protein [Bacillota bacterium]
MKKHRFIPAILGMVMAMIAIPSFAFAANEPQTWQDGTWEGTQWGYSSDITMRVTIKDGKITDQIELVSQDETPSYWNQVIWQTDPGMIDIHEDSELLESVVNAQSADVDTVSGATYSSEGVLGAIKEALSKADGTYQQVTKPDPAWFAGGKGTENEPYLIETAAHLRKVADSQSDGISYEGCHLRLNNDIDLDDGRIWRPIGYSVCAFEGHFDGNNKTISSMNVRELSKTEKNQYFAVHSQLHQIGLFGLAGSHALIENVNLTDVNINIKGDKKEPAITGAIAGELEKGGRICNASASGSITSESVEADDITAGLVGKLGGVLINSAANVEVNSSCTAADRGNFAGGLAGINDNGLIANCSASGDVTAGGEGSIIASTLVGGQYGDVVNCITSGNLTVQKATPMAGMLSGEINGGRTYNCWYKESAKMTADGAETTPKDFGRIYAKAMDKDGIYYIGNLTLNLSKYNINQVSEAVAGLNGSFEKFPIDLTKYGIGADAFVKWAVSGTKAVLTKEAAVVTYARPVEEIAPQANPMTVKAVKKTFKVKKLKKKAQVFTIASAVKASRAQGKLTYTAKAGNARSKKALTIKKGKITVKKKTKKGTYTVKVTVKAAGNDSYLPAAKAVTVKIKVK